jgi:hypothetical protein
MDVARAVRAALRRHPSIRGVRLVGSRGEGRAHALSDWDFTVETDDFAAAEAALPSLVATLEPLGELWDPYSDHACYMLMLSGPTKVDLMFPDQPRAWSEAWIATPDTLEAIDRHFWDWILWLEQKRRGGRDEILARSLGDMYRLLLQPLGVVQEPRSAPEAIDAYLAARSAREREFGARVPRRLGREVEPVVRAGAAQAAPRGVRRAHDERGGGARPVC